MNCRQCFAHFPGVGIGMDGGWPAEESYWGAGLTRETALEWGKML